MFINPIRRLLFFNDTKINQSEWSAERFFYVVGNTNIIWKSGIRQADLGLNDGQKHQLDSFVTTSLWRIIGYLWQDHVSNTDMLRRATKGMVSSLIWEWLSQAPGVLFLALFNSSCTGILGPGGLVKGQLHALFGEGGSWEDMWHGPGTSLDSGHQETRAVQDQS